jgi:serine/threonine-protein kinase
MATVHFALMRAAGGFTRTVAVKRLHPEFAKDPEFAAMLVDEARIAGRIAHPNVVATRDVVAQDGELYLVLEYVQGQTLAVLLGASREAGRAIDAPIAVTVVVSALEGLHAAHEAKSEQGRPLGVVHRDVTPHNVLVGLDGVARVLDFGVAKAAGRLQVTREGQIKGKLAYMAPEQLVGAPVDRRADVYAAGACLWEALVGERLIRGDSKGALVAEILHGARQPPGARVAGLPPGIDDVVMKALERDPERRHATAREMARALAACVDLAPASEVGAWVEALCGEELARRGARIAEIESQWAATVAAAAPRPSRRVPRAVAIGAPAVVVLAVAAFAVGRRHAHAPTATPPVASVPVVVSPLPPAPRLAPSLDLAPSPPAPSESASAPAQPDRAPRREAPRRANSPASRPAGCDPPYVYDAQGHKFFRPDCFP